MNIDNSKMKTFSTNGDLGAYDLYDWWINEFSDEERNYFKSVYRPMGSAYESLIQGENYGYREKSKVWLLTMMAGFLDGRDKFNIQIKILNKAESLFEYACVTDKYFLYTSLINYYKHLKKDVEYYSLYKNYCAKAVEISPAYKEEYNINFPNHPLHYNIGYGDFYQILIDEGKIQEATDLAIKTIREGWRIGGIITDLFEKAEQYNIKLPDEIFFDAYTKEQAKTDPYVCIDYYLRLLKDSDKRSTEAIEYLKIINNALSNISLGSYKKVETYFELGSLYFKSDNFPEATKNFNKLDAFISDISSITISKFIKRIGDLYLGINDKEQAIYWYEKGLKLNPKLAVKRLLIENKRL